MIAAGIPAETLRVSQSERPDFLQVRRIADERVVAGDRILAISVRKRVDAQNLPERTEPVLCSVPGIDFLLVEYRVASVPDSDVEHSVVGIPRFRVRSESKLTHRVVVLGVGDAKHLAPRGGIDAIRVLWIDRPFREHVVMRNAPLGVRGGKVRLSRSCHLGARRVQLPKARAAGLGKVRMERKSGEALLVLFAGHERASPRNGHVEKRLREHFLVLDHMDPAVHVAHEQAARTVSGMNQVVDPGERTLLAARRHRKHIADNDRDVPRLNGGACARRSVWRIFVGARRTRRTTASQASMSRTPARRNPGTAVLRTRKTEAIRWMRRRPTFGCQVRSWQRPISEGPSGPATPPCRQPAAPAQNRIPAPDRIGSAATARAPSRFPRLRQSP